tara:strand:- start:1552 stop:1743 length:192 start_codon:yes stop_codon:yes gene_type:complete
MKAGNVVRIKTNCKSPRDFRVIGIIIDERLEGTEKWDPHHRFKVMWQNGRTGLISKLRLELAK